MKHHLEIILFGAESKVAHTLFNMLARFTIYFTMLLKFQIFCSDLTYVHFEIKPP